MSFFYGVFQGLGHVVLTYDCFKSAGTIFSCGNGKIAHAPIKMQQVGLSRICKQRYDAPMKLKTIIFG